MKTLEDFTGSVSIVISSCDAFFDAWKPFAFFFRKYWPDCPFPIFLITNELRLRSNFIRGIHVGPDKGWASNMLIALEHIATPHLLYFQEDYFLTSPVDRAQLAADFQMAIERDAASLCFRDLSGLQAAAAPDSDRVLEVAKESNGRTRLQATLWKREALAAIIRPGETAWEMEARGSERTRNLLMFSYARNQEAPLRYLMSAIARGLWTPEAIALCRAHNFVIQPRFRAELVQNKFRRRLKVHFSKARLAFALARRRGKPIELDA